MSKMAYLAIFVIVIMVAGGAFVLHAVIDFVQGNVQYKYRLRWTEGNTIKTSGPYPIKTGSFE